MPSIATTALAAPPIAAAPTNTDKFGLSISAKAASPGAMLPMLANTNPL